MHSIRGKIPNKSREEHKYSYWWGEKEREVRRKKERGGRAHRKNK